ncbi:MAG: TetR/AcrR family transcriptional regulator [Anaerolineae bacterium]
MTTATDPIREAVTEARRAQILEAAIHVFAEKGFHKATVKDVAAAAGVADGTIYNYFKNKNDLLVAMVLQLSKLNELTGEVVRLAETAEAEQLLRFVLHDRLELVRQNQKHIRAILPQIIGDAELRQQFYEAVFLPGVAVFEQVWQAQVQAGKVRQVAAPLLVRTLLGAFFGLLLLGFIGDTFVRDNSEQFLDDTLDLFLNGMLPRAAGPETG